MDRLHGFHENVNDGSMCLCGIPAYYHEVWEIQQAKRGFIGKGANE